MICGAVKCRFKVLGLYIFVRVFRRALSKLNGGLISEGDYNINQIHFNAS